MKNFFLKSDTDVILGLILCLVFLVIATAIGLSVYFIIKYQKSNKMEKNDIIDIREEKIKMKMKRSVALGTRETKVKTKITPKYAKVALSISIVFVVISVLMVFSSIIVSKHPDFSSLWIFILGIIGIIVSAKSKKTGRIRTASHIVMLLILIFGESIILSVSFLETTRYLENMYIVCDVISLAIGLILPIIIANCAKLVDVIAISLTGMLLPAVMLNRKIEYIVFVCISIGLGILILINRSKKE